MPELPHHHLGGISHGVTAPVQYGARICAFVVYLLNYHFLPEDRLAKLVSDLFGLTMAAATMPG